MRLSVFVVLISLLLAGCAGGEYYPAGGSRSCEVDATDLAGGFRVHVPERVIADDERTTTEGWCVEVRTAGGAFESEAKVGPDQVVMLPADGAGTYSFYLYVVEPDDKYCSYSLEAYDVAYEGAGFLDVYLEYDGVSLCT